jgi:putative endopeptidase
MLPGAGRRWPAKNRLSLKATCSAPIIGDRACAQGNFRMQSLARLHARLQWSTNGRTTPTVSTISARYRRWPKTVPWRKLLRKLLFVAVCASCVVVSVGLADDSGSPTYGRWGLDTAGIDRSTKPGDDFYQYAGGEWLAHASIPADMPEVSLWRELIARTELRLRDLLETSARTAAHRPQDLNGKMGAFYRSFMDEQAVQQLGSRAIEPELTAIRQARTREALAALMGGSNSDYKDSLLSVVIDVDLRDPKRYVVYLSQGVGYLSPWPCGLGLPDRDYYLVSHFRQQKAAYHTYVEQVLTMLDWPAPALRSREIVEFETRLAQAMWTEAQDRNPVATYNPTTLVQLRALATEFPWSTFLASAGLAGVDHVVVREPSALRRITAIYSHTPVQVLQAWQAFHVADHAAPYLSKPFTDAWSAFHEKALSRVSSSNALAGSAQSPRCRVVTFLKASDSEPSVRWGGAWVSSTPPSTFRRLQRTRPKPSRALL